MYRKDEINLARKIVRLDLLREELYEELLKAMGARAPELLRRIQNS